MRDSLFVYNKFINIQAREFEDPPGLLEKTEFLLREWVTAYHDRNAGKDSRQVRVDVMNF